MLTVVSRGVPVAAVLVTVAPAIPALVRIVVALVITAPLFVVRFGVTEASLTASLAAWFKVLMINQARPNSKIPKTRSKNRGG